MEFMAQSQSATYSLNNTKDFESLFKEWFYSLSNYAYKLLLDKSSAEDAVQQVFSKLWEKRADIQVDSSIKSYLYRATYNTCMNEIRRNKKLTSIEDKQESTSSYRADADARSNDLERKIKEGLNNLPEKCRAIFVLSRYENLKYKEIAAMLDISIKTVENQMGKALKMMRVHLKEFISVVFTLLMIK
jgi:RNA polymerase sigma-70 factor (ECF subfamily)